MINRERLLGDLTREVSELEQDLRARSESVAEVNSRLRAEHESARRRERTSEAFETWRDDRITQASVAWVLSCVFVRFLEDNRLLAQPYLSGPGDRLALARDHRTLYFREDPSAEDPQYLQAIFRDVAASPAMKVLLSDEHNPLWTMTPSADAAKRLVEFWQQGTPATGQLIHDFTDPEWNTRFLGDLYQDLSDAAQKRYALKQTPEFIIAFILDRTLEPAIQECGLGNVTLIDPTCGSGHFLLESFRRLLSRHQLAAPTTEPRELAQRVLDQLFGVDLNPYAIAIARFRLLVDALRAAGISRLDQAPDFRTHLAVGDSLLHGPRRFAGGERQYYAWDAVDPLGYLYEVEDADALRDVLGRSYHVVVGNPPYIQARDPALNAAYRRRFASCAGKYQLVAPFLERFFDLALCPDTADATPAGYVGAIVASAFAKGEFGKKIVENHLALWDLGLLIDMAGVCIPGHNTSTLILIGRMRRPVGSSVRVIMSVMGATENPPDPAQGRVWLEILRLLEQPDSPTTFVSISDVPRSVLSRHPWSIGGGGAADLKVLMDDSSSQTLRRSLAVAGVFGITGADDVVVATPGALARRGVESWITKSLVRGPSVGHWSRTVREEVIFPYRGGELVPITEASGAHRWMWPYRTVLGNRATFSKGTYFTDGRPWWEWHQVALERLDEPLSIIWSELATHNRFYLDRGGCVFDRTAPMLKLLSGATDSDYLGVLALLNSSVAGFWLRQVCRPKGGDRVGKRGARVRKTAWEERFAFNALNVARIPKPSSLPVSLAQRLDTLAQTSSNLEPATLVRKSRPTRQLLDQARDEYERIQQLMIAVQEELDWDCYHAFGLVDEGVGIHVDDPPPVRLGERAFEIWMARTAGTGTPASKWFDRHGSTPCAAVPAHWPRPYREVILSRLELIRTNSHIALIERPEYKRRWNTVSWYELEQQALREWLLDRLEERRHWAAPQLTTCGKLADRVRHDAEFLEVAALYRGRDDLELTDLVAELALADAVPYLSALRYSDSGLRKRAVWERTWELQRREDAGERIQIDVPPRYEEGDFSSATYWALRGELDVPKERFIAYPLASTDDDGRPAIGWAGWDEFERAKALAEACVSRREREAWGADRLAPLLAGIAELLPRVRQWHNDRDPSTGERAGDVLAQFLEEHARSLGLAPEDLPTWTPPIGAIRGSQSRKKKA